MAAAPDFYELLAVGRDATDDEIKRSYRKLARELHPDANPGNAEAEERFKQVSLAYEVLRDPERRRRYDLYGPDALRGAGAGPGPDPFADFTSAFSDIFEAFFGGGTTTRRRAGGMVRGSDMEVAVDLGFEDAVFGTQSTVKLRAPVSCGACDASGAAPGTEPQMCTLCGGTGELRRVRQSLLGQVVTASPCHQCAGMGRYIAAPCATCRGEGRTTEERDYVVDVPAGIDNGQTLRLTGRGAAGPRGGPPGDLFVHVRVRAHPRFVRDGYDLVHVLQIPTTQAALGVHLPFETLDGDEDLVIPRGTQSGRVFRLRGRGVPRLDGRGRGDLLVRVDVQVPDDLSREEEELMRQVAVLRGESVAPADSGFFSKIRSAFK
jgi:molecular chaperone DnaJ